MRWTDARDEETRGRVGRLRQQLPPPVTVGRGTRARDTDRRGTWDAYNKCSADVDTASIARPWARVAARIRDGRRVVFSGTTVVRSSCFYIALGKYVYISAVGITFFFLLLTHPPPLSTCFLNDPSTSTTTTLLVTGRFHFGFFLVQCTLFLPPSLRPLGTPAGTPCFATTVKPPVLMGFRSECVRRRACSRFACVSATAAVCWNVFFTQIYVSKFFPGWLFCFKFCLHRVSMADVKDKTTIPSAFDYQLFFEHTYVNYTIIPPHCILF